MGPVVRNAVPEVIEKRWRCRPFQRNCYIHARLELLTLTGGKSALWTGLSFYALEHNFPSKIPRET